MNSVRQSFLASLLFAVPALAFAWGHEGHQTVGAIADSLLSGSNASVNVKQILGGMSLETVSVWADCAKGTTSSDGQTFVYHDNPSKYPECAPFSSPDEVKRFESYVSHNWKQCGSAHDQEYCHNQYHYADIANVRDHYDTTYIGANSHDVIHAINAAVAVLRGQPAAAPMVIQDQKEALRLLSHFVGDIHQPLHVVAIYLDAQGQEVDPDAKGYKKGNDTSGGNAIKDGSTNLHAEWDAIPAQWTVGGSNFASLQQTAANIAPATGNPDSWAQSWATDTIQTSRIPAFSGLTFNMRPTTNPNPEAVAESWDVQNTVGDYRSHEDELKFQQLAKAGYRLAEVLKSIWPDAGPVVTPATKGYLPASQLANIKIWLPDQPLAKSTAQADDLARFKNSRALLSQPRGQSAAEDDVFEPSQVVERFNDALGLVLNADNAPTLMAMLNKIEEDANQLVAPVKVKVKDGGRVRPFVAYPKLPSCLSPKDLAGHRDSDINVYHLDQSGAYPSTHALVGMMVAMVMSEVVPERADNLLARGYEFGESRLVCGFHYNTDLVAGRLAASALYSRLHANDVFLADLTKLRQEVARAKASLH